MGRDFMDKSGCGLVDGPFIDLLTFEKRKIHFSKKKRLFGVESKQQQQQSKVFKQLKSQAKYSDQ